MASISGLFKQTMTTLTRGVEAGAEPGTAGGETGLDGGGGMADTNPFA
ncbi:MAG: hypothetical protein J6Y19_06380 [Kiritimatiellae bacterium]|nr:hypothetical protein [Kiritimatiellia bacterium]